MVALGVCDWRISEVKALVIGTDSRGSVVEVPDGDLERLSALQRAVGGFIEAVGDARCVVYVNTDGKSERMAVNPGATWLVNVLQPDFALFDVIAGPAVVLGRDGPEDCDVPDDIVDLYLAASGRRGEG